MGLPKTLKKPVEPPKSVDEIIVDLIELGKKGEFEGSTIFELCDKLDLISKEWLDADFYVVMAVSILEDEGYVQGVESLQIHDPYGYPILLARYRYVSDIERFFHNLFIPVNSRNTYGN